MTGTTVADEAWHTLPGLDAAKVMHVEYGSGLSAQEAAARLAELGPNRLEGGAGEPRWRAFARGYRDPVQLVLVAAAVLSLVVGEPATAVVVLGLTLVNAALLLHEAGRPRDPAAALGGQLAISARVRRDGRVQRLPAELLVPGDMVLVEAGEVVPADGRLVDSVALAIDESALTGESFPAAKAMAAVDDPDAPLGDRTGMAYMATTVTGGRGELVVTATGMQTEAGRIASRLRDGGEPGPLVRAPARLLMLGAGALAAALTIQLVRGHDADAVATVAVAFALAAVPTALPAAVAALLAHAGTLLARAGTAVRGPRAAAQLGVVSALTVGTAGTLTAGRMTAVELLGPGRRYTVTDGAIQHVAGEGDPPLERVLLALALAGDPTGGALAELAGKAGLDVAATRATHPRVAELPFDAAYELTATFHRMAEGTIGCFVAGPADQLLSRSATDAASRERQLAETAQLTARGLAVIAVARRDLRRDAFDPAGELLPLADDLTPLALVGVADRPWPEAKDAVAQAQTAGLEVRIVTGDRAAPAAATARELGIAGRTITGSELAAMSDTTARSELATVGVVARAEPLHALRLVAALAGGGRVVGAIGHRAGDAPALMAADVGIATGPGVAAEAARIVIGDGRLATIVRAVEAARGLRDNLDGAVRFQLGAVAALILTFLGASAFDIAGGLPLEPLQVLYLSFTAVLFQTIGVGYGAAAAGVRVTAAIAVLQAAATLMAMAIAEHEHALATVRTTGLVTFGVATVLASLALRRDRALLLASAASLTALVIVA
jgi:Ca2+-transporting ATPase